MKFSKILIYSGCYAIPSISYFFITSYFNSELAIQFYNYFLNKLPVTTWPNTYILGTIYLFTPTQNFQKHEQKGLMPQCVRKESKEKRKYKDIVDKLCSSVTATTTRVDVTSSENIVFFLR